VKLSKPTAKSSVYPDSTVANWERGKSIPFQKNLEKIAAVVGTTVDELIGTKHEREAVESERPTKGLSSVTLPFIIAPILAAPMIPEAGSIDNPAPALAFFAARNLDEPANSDR